MRAGVDLTQLHDGDVGIDLRGIEPGMSKQLLDVSNVGPVFEHVGGARMAQLMAGAGAAQGLGHDPPDPVAQIPDREAIAVAAKEKGAFALRGLQQGPGLLLVQP